MSDEGLESSPPDPPADRRSAKEFLSDLESLINSYSLENGSDTPDFILAEFLGNVLAAFDNALLKRQKWYAPEGERGREK